MASQLRSAALRLPMRSVAPSTLRLASLRTMATTTGPDSTAVSEYQFQHTTATPLQDPAIPHGVEAYVVMPSGQLPDNEFNQSRQAVVAHASHTTDLWRKISFYVAIPACIVTAIWVYFGEKEHEEHRQHMIEANGGERPERKVYSYMNIRTKPFPWGNQTLFFNPEHNIPAEEP